MTLTLDAYRPQKIDGEILHAKDIRAHNTFEKPEQVVPKPFTGYKIDGRKVTLTLPPASVVAVTL